MSSYRQVVSIGREVWKRADVLLDQPSYSVQRKADGLLGTAWIATKTFRFMLNGCNVAGMPSDIIFAPESGGAWVVLAEEYGPNYSTV